MNTDQVLEKVVKAIEDEDGKKLLTGFLRSISYFYWTVRLLRNSTDAVAKIRSGEPLSGKESRRLVQLVAWSFWYAGANWYTGIKDTEEFRKAGRAVAARLKEQQHQRSKGEEEALKAAKDIVNRMASTRRASSN